MTTFQRVLELARASEAERLRLIYDTDGVTPWWLNRDWKPFLHETYLAHGEAQARPTEVAAINRLHKFSRYYRLKRQSQQP